MQEDMDFSTLSEHTVRAALESEDDEHPIVVEVTRLMKGYVKRIEKYRDYGEDITGVVTPTAATPPIEIVAMECLSAMMEDEENAED